MADESLIVELKSGAFGPPLWLLHPVGGNLLFAARFVSRLVYPGPVFGIMARGLDGRRAPFTRLGDAASHYLDLVRAHQPRGPYLLSGPSFGGNLAFEMARRLWARGDEVALVALFDAHGPRYPRPDSLVRRMIARLVRGRGPANDAAAMANVPEGESETLHVLRRVAHAHVTALRSERPQPYRGEVHLFRADTPPDWPGMHFDDPTNGWSRVVRGSLRVVDVPGTHQFLMDPPAVDGLAAAVSEVLAGIVEPRPEVVHDHPA